MMAIKYIECIKRIYCLRDRNKIMYLCGHFIQFLHSNTSIDDCFCVKYYSVVPFNINFSELVQQLNVFACFVLVKVNLSLCLTN
jgi:hypothetical protein